MGAVYGTVIGNVLTALWSIVFLAFIGLGVLMLKLVRRQGLTGHVADGLVLLGIGASPFLMRHAMVVMSDIPALSLVMAGFACVVFARERRPAWWYFSAALAWGLAMAMRFAAVPVVVAALVFLLLNRLPGAARRGSAVLLVVLAGVAGILCTFRPDWLAAQLVGTPLEDWSALNLFRAELHSDDGVLHYRFPNLIYVLSIAVHPGFLPIGALLLPFFRREDLRSFISGLAGTMLVVYLLFTAGLPFQNDRVMLMAQPLIVLVLAPAFGRAWVWYESHALRPTLLSVVIAVAQIGLFVRAISPFIHSAEIEKDLAAVVGSMDAHHVYTHGMGPALSNYCPGTEVTELWYGRIERFEPGALVLVAPQNLEEQWQGLHPWENWVRVWEQGVERVEERPDGWVIVRVR